MSIALHQEVKTLREQVLTLAAAVFDLQQRLMELEAADSEPLPGEEPKRKPGRPRKAAQ